MPPIRINLVLLAALIASLAWSQTDSDAAAAQRLAAQLAANPNAPGLQSRYGQALLRTGDADGATDAFEAVLKADPDDLQANLGLGQILVVRQQFVRAKPFFAHVLQVRPQSSEAKLGLAECLVQEKDFAKARPYLETVVANMPDSVEAHETLAAAYRGLGRTDEANGEHSLAQSLDEARKASDPGPKPHQAAPDFTLPDSATGQTFHLKDLRGKTPLVLIFGSYTCPNFRWAADELKSMGQQYGSRVRFMMVYIREAHADDNWQSTRNVREGVRLAQASNMEQKQDHAKMCSRKLHLPFPALVDGMDGAIENAYAAWPSRAFIISKDGRVAYSTRLTEFDFHPDEMRSVLRGLE